VLAALHPSSSAIKVLLQLLCGTYRVSFAYAANERLLLVAFPGLSVTIGTVRRHDLLAGHLRVIAKLVTLRLTRVDSAVQLRPTK
jgi:hypothetical protein